MACGTQAPSPPRSLQNSKPHGPRLFRWSFFLFTPLGPQMSDFGSFFCRSKNHQKSDSSKTRPKSSHNRHPPPPWPPETAFVKKSIDFQSNFGAIFHEKSMQKSMLNSKPKKSWTLMKNRCVNGPEIYRKSLRKLIVFEKCLMQNNVLKPMDFQWF